MFLFQNNESVSICLKNKSPYVRWAVEDLKADFLRVSHLTALPQVVDNEEDAGIVIEQNTFDGDAISDESFQIVCDGKQVKISANTYLGTMWGIYTFSEKILGVQPCYLFNDLEIEKRHSLEIQAFQINDSPKQAGFRGIFINDEDLLTAWKGGSVRPIDYTWYTITVPESVMDKVVETALRLKLNLIIPATFLDIDNPPEKLLADCVAKRGIFLSQHHIEPLGVSHFAFEKYCKKFHKNNEFSFIKNAETLLQAWEYCAEKWAEYENVVWQVGLRGKLDRPVWEEETPRDDELKKYADYINCAVKNQKEIVACATKGKAKYFSTTLWMEGSKLMEKGLLDFGKDTIVVFSDNGPNQMFGKDYDGAPRCDGLQYGIYYHLQYHDIGPHLAPQTTLQKLSYNLKKAKAKGDDKYIVVNVSNVREFDFEMKAYAQLAWAPCAFSSEEFLDAYARLYGEESEQAKQFVNAYFDNLPCIDTEYLRYVHAKYFNYNYQEQTPSNVKNFILKDELVLVKGSEITWDFHREVSCELYEKMREALKQAMPIYARLADELDAWSGRLSDSLQRHVRCKWWLYAKTLLHFYRWFVDVYEGKLAYDKGEFSVMQEKINDAGESLEEYLVLRKCAEYGEFENWYRGDLKMNVIQRLLDTRKLLGQTPKFL